MCGAIVAGIHVGGVTGTYGFREAQPRESRPDGLENGSWPIELPAVNQAA
jgi:hypothetical protein